MASEAGFHPLGQDLPDALVQGVDQVDCGGAEVVRPTCFVALHDW